MSAGRAQQTGKQGASPVDNDANWIKAMEAEAMEDELDNYRMEDDPEWLEWYNASEAKEREQQEQAFTPGDRWSDPAVADPDCLLINWL